MNENMAPTIIDPNGGTGGWFMWVFFLFFLLAWGKGGSLFGSGNASGLNFVNNDFLYTNLNTTLNNGFNAVLDRQFETMKDTLQGFNSIERGICSLGAATTGAISDASYRIQQGLNDNSYRLQQGVYDLSSQMAQLGFQSQQCCCETNRNIDAVRAENYKNTCEITNAIHAEGEATRALINHNVMQGLRDELQAAQLQIGNMSQTQALLANLKPYPIPAYITSSPYASATPATYNFGCNPACANA